MVFMLFNGSLAQHALLANRVLSNVSTECADLQLICKNSKVNLIIWKFLSEATNNRISVSTVFFPQEVKIAIVILIDRKQIRSIEKKVSNFRSVNLLSCFPLNYETYGKHLCPHISACRKDYSSQHVLIRLLEEWRKHLDIWKSKDCAHGRSSHWRCFPVNFTKFLKTSFLQNTSGRLLLSWILPKPTLTLIHWLTFILIFQRENGVSKSTTLKAQNVFCGVS